MSCILDCNESSSELCQKTLSLNKLTVNCLKFKLQLQLLHQ